MHKHYSTNFVGADSISARAISFVWFSGRYGIAPYADFVYIDGNVIYVFAHQLLCLHTAPVAV